MSKINKMINAAADAGKPITDPKQMKPKPRELVTVKNMSREPASAPQFERLIQNLIKNYREENYAQNEVILRDLLSKNSLWSSQAYQLLHTFKEDQQF